MTYTYTDDDGDKLTIISNAHPDFSEPYVELTNTTANAKDEVAVYVSSSDAPRVAYELLQEAGYIYKLDGTHISNAMSELADHIAWEKAALEAAKKEEEAKKEAAKAKTATATVTVKLDSTEASAKIAELQKQVQDLQDSLKALAGA